MAYGDIGLFLPTESTYLRPGTYEAALSAEAAKTAQYLASMDQFYANLEEAQSEFAQTLAFKEKELASREALASRGYDIQEQQVENQATYNTELLDLRRQELEMQATSQSQSYDLEQKKLDLLRMQTEHNLEGPTASQRWEQYQQIQKQALDYNQRFIDTLQKVISRGAERTSGRVSSEGTSYDSNAASSSGILNYDNPDYIGYVEGSGEVFSSNTMLAPFPEESTATNPELTWGGFMPYEDFKYGTDSKLTAWDIAQ